MKIANIEIGLAHKPFIIAEMSGNHNQSLDNALAIVRAAAEAGVSALKLQTYTADTITMDHRGGLFEIDDKNSLWNGKNIYELYQMAHTPWEWHKAIFDLAHELGLVCFSSPFDETAVDFLETLNAPAYKIASFENGHFPLLKKVAQTGKPVIISSGATKLSDLAESVKYLQDCGCKDITVLKCTSTYPATPESTNLKTIPHLREMFEGCEVGLSDHTMGVGASVAAVALGATVIEKHFCLSRALGGVDSAFSLEPAEMRSLVVETERAWQALGRVTYGVQKSEERSVDFKRSIYVTRDIAEGEEFSTENLRVIRPGDGLHPRFWEQVLGQKASKAIKRGTPLSWGDL